MIESTEPASEAQILVVDADDDTRALYSASFALVGCDVIEASDGREALTKALGRPPSLVITEIKLPLIDGFALCEILRRDWATADMPILVVTAEARPAELERARRAGADTVLIKPTPIETIVGEMRWLVADSQDRRGNTVRTTARSRFGTATSAAPGPSLVCPSCGRPLTYESSYVGGVSNRHPEQWDYYVCRAWCGTFQYRQRTGKVRRVEDGISGRLR